MYRSFQERTDNNKLSYWSVYVIVLVDKGLYVGVSQTEYVRSYRIPQQYGEKNGIGKQAEILRDRQPLLENGKRFYRVFDIPIKMTYQDIQEHENLFVAQLRKNYPDYEVFGGTECVGKNVSESIIESQQKILEATTIRIE